MPVTLTLPSIKGTLLSKEEMEKNLTDLRDAVNIARLETVTTNSASFNANTKQVILANATPNDVVINLPSAAVSLDMIYLVKKIDATVNTVTLQADGAETIDGNNTHVLTTQNESVWIISDGTNWYIIG
jgi:hypothetical protein